MKHSSRVSRRAFLAHGSAVAAPLVVSAGVLGLPGCGRPSPTARINVGLIGLGAQGFDNLRQCLRLSDVQVVAVCDVDPLHYRDNAWGQEPAYGREPAQAHVQAHYAAKEKSGKYAGCAAVADFRELCARPDIDAIVISTPDHWHALCALEALNHGKDVYGEKPLTHFYHEGELLCAEVARRKAVFQTGTQQRSMPVFRRAVEIVRNGHLGRIERIEVGLPDGYDKPMGDITVTAPQERSDYEMWTGPAPLLPYMRARHHRWWRGHTAYGGGTLMDWIGHHNDIAEWALGEDGGGLERVEAVGWTMPETDVYDTPEHFEIRCRYANGVESSIADRHKEGTTWFGERGWLFVTRSIIEASDPRWAAADFQPGPRHVEPSTGHHRNFFDAVRERGRCVAPPDVALRSITPGFLGYVSHALGRPIRWDAERRSVIDDAAADKLLRAGEYRAPWKLPGV
jgi:glucose-fructose oxidoreductase